MAEQDITTVAEQDITTVWCFPILHLLYKEIKINRHLRAKTLTLKLNFRVYRMLLEGSEHAQKKDK